VISIPALQKIAEDLTAMIIQLELAAELCGDDNVKKILLTSSGHLKAARKGLIKEWNLNTSWAKGQKTQS
jgi:hypothetical protein